MGAQSEQRDAHKFDTQSLLRGIEAAALPLDSILQEFHSAQPAAQRLPQLPVEAKEIEAVAAAPQEQPVVVQSHCRQTTAPQEEAEPLPSLEQAPLPASPLPQEIPGSLPYVAVQEVAPGAAKKKRKKPAKPAKAPRAEQPRQPEPTPDSALRVYGKRVRQMRARLLPVTLCAVLAVLLSVGTVLQWSVFPWLELPANRNLALLGLQLVSMLLCLDLLLRGCKAMLRLRFSALAVSTAVAFLTLLEALVQWKAVQLPFCAVACLALCFSLRAALQKQLAMRRSVKVLCTQAQPVEICTVSGAWPGGSCLVKVPGEPAGFILDMEKADCADAAMGIYGPILLAGTLLGALVLRSRQEISFLWTWTALVCAGFPLVCGCCFSGPWAQLSQRLLRVGAAIRGWRGAKTIREAKGAAVLDGDLFPEGSVHMTGMKLFGAFQGELAVHYAAALIVPFGGTLGQVFQKLLEEQGGQLLEPAGLRAYEGGGIGGDIRGDVVQVGSMGFMQLMGIRIPKGTNVRQAVYLAINGELAGLFALSYGKSKGVSKGLRRLQRSMCPVFALRDFLLSPGLLRQQWLLEAEQVEYPGVEARMALSAQELLPNGGSGAVVSTAAFSAYAEVIAGAVRLHAAAQRNLRLCLLSGLLGLLLPLAGLWLGWHGSSIMVLMMAYGLLWAFVVRLSTAVTARY